MRRILVILGLCLVALAAASPAHAQRDPFEPAIESGAQEPGAEQPATQIEPEPGEAAPPQRLADTGSDARSWLALAYALIVLGVGVLAFVRVGRLPAR